MTSSFENQNCLCLSKRIADQVVIEIGETLDFHPFDATYISPYRKSLNLSFYEKLNSTQNSFNACYNYWDLYDCIKLCVNHYV